MAQSSSKQQLADLMHGYNQIAELARRLYNDHDLKDWAIQKSLEAQGNFTETNEKLKNFFSIDFTSDTAKKSIIKEGSEVEVLVNHMDAMLSKVNKALLFIKENHNGEIPYQFSSNEYGLWMARYAKNSVEEYEKFIKEVIHYYERYSIGDEDIYNKAKKLIGEV